jgi:hypothetical protein
VADGTTAAPQASLAPSRPLGQPRQPYPSVPSGPAMPLCGSGTLPQPVSSNAASLQPASNKPCRGASSKLASNRVKEQASSKPILNCHRDLGWSWPLASWGWGAGRRRDESRVSRRSRENESQRHGTYGFFVFVCSKMGYGLCSHEIGWLASGKWQGGLGWPAGCGWLSGWWLP